MPFAGGLFTVFYTKESPELVNGVAVVPDVKSFGGGKAATPSPPKALKSPSSSSKGAGSSKAPLPKNPIQTQSVYGDYRSSSPNPLVTKPPKLEMTGPPSVVNGRRSSTIQTPTHLMNAKQAKGTAKAPALFSRPTHTSQVKEKTIKLSVRINGESGQPGNSALIVLPEEIDTLQELYRLIQAKMKLDKKMRYARELFLPDGTKITSMDEIADAAAAYTTVTVGGGEPFDHDAVQPSAAVLHAVGGGRAAAASGKRQLGDKQKRTAQKQANKIRGTGHGMVPLTPAVKDARTRKLEENRQVVATLKNDSLVLAARRVEDRVAKQNVVKAKHAEEVEKMRRRRRLQEIRNRQKRGEVISEEQVQMELDAYEQVRGAGASASQLWGIGE